MQTTPSVISTLQYLNGLKNADDVIKVLHEGSVIKQERENPHLGDIFIEGVFSDEKEIEKFVITESKGEMGYGEDEMPIL